MLQVTDIIWELEQLAPSIYAENFDNVGLLVGNKQNNCTGVLVCLDITVDVIFEAIEKKYNLIICYHPFIFKTLKNIDTSSQQGYCLQLLLTNNINLYCLHTNLDKSPQGANHYLAKHLGLQNHTPLIPEKSLWKLTTYIPLDYYQKVQTALAQAGAGHIGNYEACSFSVNGTGSFKALESSTPFVGNKGVLHTQAEKMLHMVFHTHLKDKVLKALKKSHPYEKIAYDIISIETDADIYGLGQIGFLNKPLSANTFLEILKDFFKTPYLRHSIIGKDLQKIAILAGSGALGISYAKNQQADVFITGDLKYHDFFSGTSKFMLIDTGHYETERHIPDFLVTYLSKKIPNFAILKTTQNTNPVYYF